tara:strand:+ start:710 stop:2077 length:1368 start_codon:yes stop_codon:yes gene_type:complete
LKKNNLVWILFTIILIAFLLIEFKGLTSPQPGDENVYFYMGKLFSELTIPYKDFFYAHPPLQIILLGLVFKIFGTNFIALKAIPLISTIISAFLIFKLSKKKFGTWEAILTLIFFLFSYSVLFNSVLSFGINIASMLFLFGLYQYYVKNNYLTAGIFFGLASITKLLSLIPIAVIFSLIFLRDKNKFLKILIGFSIIFITINLLFIILFGFNYINPVYKYHLLKSFQIDSNFSEYYNIIKLNWIIFALAFVSLFFKGSKLLDFKIISLTYLIALLISSRIFNYYFIIVIPLLAILSGYYAVRLLKKINKKIILIPLILFLILLIGWDLTANVSFLHNVGFNEFERGDDIIEFLNLKFDKSTPIVGDDSSTPLIALMDDRIILNNYIDTNSAVFESKLIDINRLTNDISNQKTIVVLRSNQGLSAIKEFRDFINTNCNLLSIFNTKLEGEYLIYDC